MKYEVGYTIVELVTVITIIGILVVLSYGGIGAYRQYSNDAERADDVNSIALRLESSYTNQDLAKPAYPSINEFNADSPTMVRTLSRLSKDAVKAPGSNVVSVIGATSTSQTEPVAGGPTKDKYVYQPLTANDAICNWTTQTCVRFFFYYRTERDDVLHKVKSIHQQ